MTLTALALFAALTADSAARAPGDTALIELRAATAKARRPEGRSVEMKASLIRRIPSAMNDPVRAMGFAPGVTVQNDVNVRPLVRGGEAEETRVVLNGLPLMQPYHVGGVFSLFNLSLLESVELYRGDFPVEQPGALSGILRLKTNPRLPTKPAVKTNLSLVRGDAYAEVPLVPGGLSVFGAGQSFLFNQSLHGILDGASALSGDGEFRREMAGYRERVNMPDFRDYHWGAALARSDFRAGYLGSRSSDAYGVVIPKQTNILSKINPSFGDPTAPVGEGIASPKRKPDPRGRKLSVDSVSSVAIGSDMHFLSLGWDVNPDNHVEHDFGYQAQDWDVGFKKDVAQGNPALALSQSSRYFNYRLAHTWSGHSAHQVKAGASYDYRAQEYRMDLPYVLYDVIVNGNMDMLEPLGYFAGDGFTLLKEDSARTGFDYLGELPSRIRFSHSGVLEERIGGLFASHAWKTAPGTLTYGVRAEYHGTSREFFPAPRASWRMALTEKDELLAAAGLYAQNDLPFHERDRNRSLRSEKSAQASLRWTRALAKGFKLALEGYCKGYYDLAAPRLVPDGTVDLEGLLLARPDAGRSEAEIAALRSMLDTVTDAAALPDSVREAVYEVFGGLKLDYANTGTGSSLGAEAVLFYEPGEAWKGWLSADFNRSERRDRKGEAAYPFRHHRPVVVNWVNWFDVPGGFDLALTYRWALGRPYTPYTAGMEGGSEAGVIRVGARNSGRLSQYSRLDLRLARNAQLWGGKLQGYLEIWNAMNSPNYFARDEETGELKAAQLNWPFPIFFVGMSADL